MVGIGRLVKQAVIIGCRQFLCRPGIAGADAEPEIDFMYSPFRIRIRAGRAVDQCQRQGIAGTSVAVFAVAYQNRTVSAFPDCHTIPERRHIIVPLFSYHCARRYVITVLRCMIRNRDLIIQYRNDFIPAFMPVDGKLHPDGRLVLIQNIKHFRR